MTSEPAAEARAFRLHIRPTLEGRVILTAAQWCLDNEVAGIGWPVEGEPATPAEYERLVVERYESRRPASLRFSRLVPGDYLWVRSRKGEFFLGRVASPWKYTGDAHEAAGQGLFSLVRVEQWSRVGTAMDVPGVVLRSYGPRTGTFHELRVSGGGRSDWFGQWCAARTNGQRTGLDAVKVVEFVLTATDVEDLVALYLQRRERLYLVPPSRARDDPNYDLELTAPGGDDGPGVRRIVVQVKTGDQDVDAAALPADAGERWVYAAVGPDRGPDNPFRLSKNDLAAFLEEERSWLPKRFTDWLA